MEEEADPVDANVSDSMELHSPQGYLEQARVLEAELEEREIEERNAEQESLLQWKLELAQHHDADAMEEEASRRAAGMEEMEFKIGEKLFTECLLTEKCYFFEAD